MDYTYDLVAVHRVVDGDTFDLELAQGYDFGFGHTMVDTHTGRFRLVIIDTPDGGRPEREATLASSRWLTQYAHECTVQTYRDPDNFGRYLADIYRPDGQTLSSYLLEQGYARYQPRKR